MKSAREARSALIIDDQTARLESPGELTYGRQSFIEDFGALGYTLAFSEAFSRVLSEYSVAAAVRDLEALAVAPTVVLLDIRFGDSPLLGMDILVELSSRFPQIPVIMMTGSAEAELMSRCFQLGAVDYLVKPLQADLLKLTLDRYAEQPSEYWLVGQAKSFVTTVDQVARASEGGASNILLLGDSGTGKELFARLVHRHGPRSASPFQPVHLSGIPENLVEAELFGFSAGAFTGATRGQQGRLVEADGGVVFLDEIADLRQSTQAALLRVLETREVRRIGDGRVSRINVQVVAATNADLPLRVKENTFRLDLYSRIGGTIVQLPSLSQRREDIPHLVRHLVRRVATERGIAFRPLPYDPDLFATLPHNDIPGNVRELYNAVQRAFDRSRGSLPPPAAVISELVSKLGAAAKLGGGPPSRAGALLEELSEQTLRSAPEFIDAIILRELSLLHSALLFTRDPVTGLTSRAKAAALLLQRSRCSTNDFDRWLRRVLSRMTPAMLHHLASAYPDLIRDTTSQLRKDQLCDRE